MVANGLIGDAEKGNSPEAMNQSLVVKGMAVVGCSAAVRS